MSPEQNPQIKVGLTEAADIINVRRVGGRDLHLPNGRIFDGLTERIERAKAIGFQVYEAMPTWATARDIRRTISLDPSLLRRTYKDLINVHQRWTTDRSIYPMPSQSDTLFSYIVGRWLSSALVSDVFIPDRVVYGFSKKAGVSISTHWPWIESMGDGTPEMRRRKKNQYRLDESGVRQVAETHALIHMTSSQLAEWLEKDSSRQIAWTSGKDPRDREYGSAPSVNSQDFFGRTGILYVKGELELRILRADLEGILNARTDGQVYLMANYPDGANEETANRLHDMIREVQGG